jgi:hypothetical protein
MNNNISRSMACAALHGLLASLTAEGAPYSDRIDKAADLIAFVCPNDPTSSAGNDHTTTIIDGSLSNDPDMLPFRRSKADAWLPRLLIYLAKQREYAYDELKGILSVFRFAQKLGVDVFARDRFGTTAFVSAINGFNFDLAVFMHHYAAHSMIFLQSDALPFCAVPTDDADLKKRRPDSDSDRYCSASSSSSDSDDENDGMLSLTLVETTIPASSIPPSSSSSSSSSSSKAKPLSEKARLTTDDLKRRGCWRNRCRSDYERRAIFCADPRLTMAQRMARIGSTVGTIDISVESGDDDEKNSDDESIAADTHVCRKTPRREHTRYRKEKHRRTRRLIAAQTAADLFRTAFIAYANRFEPVQVYVRSLFGINGLVDLVLLGYLDLVAPVFY